MKNKLINKSLVAIVAIFTLLTLLGGAKSSAQTTTTSQPIKELKDMPCSETGCPKYQMKGFGMMDESGYRFGEKGSFTGYGNGEREDMFKYFMPAFGAGLIGAGVVAIVIGILFLAFWIWMLVHAIKHDIEYKPIWILVLWFMSIVGAIVYYFAVKRKNECYCCMECDMCEDGKCKCEEVKEEEVK